MAPVPPAGENTPKVGLKVNLFRGGEKNSKRGNSSRFFLSAAAGLRPGVGRGPRPCTALPHLPRAAGAQPGSTLVQGLQSLSESFSRHKPGRNWAGKAGEPITKGEKGFAGPVLNSCSQPAQIPDNKILLGSFFPFLFPI